MRISAFIWSIALLIALGQSALSEARAQFAPPLQLAPQQTVPCESFHKNDNGSWSPTRQVTITSPDGSMRVTLGPGASFGSGVRFAGIDLYTLLEQNCR